MWKTIPLIIFFYFLVIFQTSFAPHLEIFGNTPNFILAFLLIFILLEAPKNNFSYCAAFLAGIFIDIFSNNFLGATAIFLLLLTFLLKSGVSLLNKITFPWFIFFSAAALFFYSFFLQPGVYLLHSLSFKDIFNLKFMVFFPPHFALNLGYNLFFIIIFYFIAKILKNARALLLKNN